MVDGREGALNILVKVGGSYFRNKKRKFLILKAFKFRRAHAKTMEKNDPFLDFSVENLMKVTTIIQAFIHLSTIPRMTD